MKSSSCFLSRSTSPPHSVTTLATSRSCRSAKRRCSSVTYSWRRSMASFSANSKDFCRGFAIISSALLNRTQQRKLLLPCHGCGLRHLHLGDFVSVNTGHADSFHVDVQHDLDGLILRHVEHRLQHLDHEIHGGVVIVVEQHPEKRRLLRFFFALRDRQLGGLRQHSGSKTQRSRTVFRDRPQSRARTRSPRPPHPEAPCRWSQRR